MIVKRYDVIDTCGGRCAEVEVQEDGNWVEWEEYEKLKRMHDETLAALRMMVEDSEAAANGDPVCLAPSHDSAVRTIAKATGSAA